VPETPPCSAVQSPASCEIPEKKIKKRHNFCTVILVIVFATQDNVT